MSLLYKMFLKMQLRNMPYLKLKIKAWEVMFKNQN